MPLFGIEIVTTAYATQSVFFPVAYYPVRLCECLLMVCFNDFDRFLSKKVIIYHVHNYDLICQNECNTPLEVFLSFTCVSCGISHAFL
jgi:hypothetical protein